MLGDESVGKKYGRLLIVSFSHISKSLLYVNCKCDCGSVKTIKAASIVCGRTKSCGCLAIESRTKHGLWGSKEYKAWNSMINRCRNKKHKQFKDYGGRGISVCKSWGISFKNFFHDMGVAPTPHHSLDRINVNDNYKKSNCRWVGRSEQALNKRKTCSNSKYLGVIKSKNGKRWHARVSYKYKMYLLGTFDTQAEAAMAINKKIKELGLPDSFARKLN